MLEGRNEVLGRAARNSQEFLRRRIELVKAHLVAERVIAHAVGLGHGIGKVLGRNLGEPAAHAALDVGLDVGLHALGARKPGEHGLQIVAVGIVGKGFDERAGRCAERDHHGQNRRRPED